MNIFNNYRFFKYFVPFLTIRRSKKKKKKFDCYKTVATCMSNKTFGKFWTRLLNQSPQAGIQRNEMETIAFCMTQNFRKESWRGRGTRYEINYKSNSILLPCHERFYVTIITTIVVTWLFMSNLPDLSHLRVGNKKTGQWPRL